MMDKRFVKVTWHDAADDGRTWVPDEDIAAFTAELCVVISWGYLAGESPKYVTLAADYIAEGTWGRVTKIPRKMIVKLEDYEAD